MMVAIAILGSGGCSKSEDFVLERKQTKGYSQGHEWVDLGLSVKWATCNIGASNPQEYGDYIAWGEVYEKSYYDDENCETFGKYYNSLPSSKDAARKRWGDTWRMPTETEVFELVTKCAYRWISKSGVLGYEFTGPNGNSIFIPAGGSIYGSSISDIGYEAMLWTTSPANDCDDDDWENIGSYILYYDHESGVNPSFTWYARRSLGLNIRPVLAK